MVSVLFILIIIAVVLFLVARHTKKLKLPNVYLVTGAVKSGKSAFSVGMAEKKYKKNLFSWWFLLPFRLIVYKCALLRDKKRRKKYKSLKEVKREDYIPLKPMLYANIPLRNVKYNPFTIDILLRKVRIPNKSVVLLDECSLVADSMLFSDKLVNEQLQLFVKLFGHYSHGGTLIVNTQSLKDLHFSFKRCVAQYLYIYKMDKFPFVNRFKVREMLYQSDDETTSNVSNKFNSDVEDTMLNIYHSNKYLKHYDCYCYSIFTDNLKYQVDYDAPVKKRKDSLKAHVLVTLQDYKTLQDFKNKEVKVNENTK